MKYRQSLHSLQELKDWYDAKYMEMGGTWFTPPEEWERHLDDFGVTIDHSKYLLDVGCGDGSFVLAAGKRVISEGIEISEVAIASGVKNCYDSETHHGSRAFIVPRICDICTLAWPGDRWDYITSMGSLEHVMDLPAALQNIHRLLRVNGLWYFYLPNEEYVHEDQPNERTATAEEWEATFARHGLIADHRQRWGGEKGACTAIWGHKDGPVTE